MGTDRAICLALARCGRTPPPGTRVQRSSAWAFFLFQRRTAVVQQPLPLIRLLLLDRKQLDSAPTQGGNWLSPGLMPATSRINKRGVGAGSDLGCLPGAQAGTDDTSESPLRLCPRRSTLFSKTQINEVNTFVYALWTCVTFACLEFILLMIKSHNHTITTTM